MNLRRFSYVVAFLAAATVTAACGSSSMDHSSMSNNASTTMAAGPAKAADRTVDVNMVDIGFAPAALSVNAGETVKFVFHNTGKVDHEAIIGDETVQSDHEQKMMAGGQGMEMSDANSVTVKPGATGELTYTFAGAGQTVIGCHELGHYAAGMKVAVTAS